MVTWMVHPKHGQHPALGHEIETLKANGWTLRPPKEAAPVAEPEPAAPVVFAPTVSALKRTRKVKQ